MNILLFDKNYELENSDYITILENNLPNYNIRLYANYKEAISVYKNKTFDIVLIDFTTNDGKAFLQDINRLNSLQKIITMGYTLSCSSEIGCPYCIDNFNKRRLIKPIKPVDLYKTIKDFDNISCNYSNKFTNPKLLINDLLQRYQYFNYDEDKSIVFAKKNDVHELKELLNIMSDLNTYNIKFEIINETSLKIY